MLRPQHIGFESGAPFHCGRCKQANIRAAKQDSKSILVGRLRLIELTKTLVDVEGAPLRTAAIATRRLDLDDVGAQIGQNAARQPAQLDP